MPRPADVIGIDVGGANLKLAADDGRCVSEPFPLWQRPDDLASRLIALIDRLISRPAGNPTHLAATMTGELADCFADHAVGVRCIVGHLLTAARTVRAASIKFYGVDGEFHDPDIIDRDPDRLAASNWHASAAWVARQFASDGYLIDIGSTTTDIIPIRRGGVATPARSDFQRLLRGELVYIGCRRTPVASIVDSLSLSLAADPTTADPTAGRRGEPTRRVAYPACPVMNERFATLDDVALLLGHVPDDPSDRDTADAMPRTAAAAVTRLARMVGLDGRHVDRHAAVDMAHQIRTAAASRIAQGLRKVARLSTPATQPPANQDVTPAMPHIVLAGHGQWLITAKQVKSALRCPRQSPVLDLADQIGPDASRNTPALAIAAMYRRQLSAAPS